MPNELRLCSEISFDIRNRDPRWFRPAFSASGHPELREWSWLLSSEEFTELFGIALPGPCLTKLEVCDLAEDRIWIWWLKRTEPDPRDASGKVGHFQTALVLLDAETKARVHRQWNDYIGRKLHPQSA